MKTLLSVILAGMMLGGLFLAACSSSSSESKLIVATDASWKPFEFLD